MKTLYQYTIKTDGRKTVLTEGPATRNGRCRLPLACIYQDAEANPVAAAGLLRDLAKWAIEQAEIIEELETGKAPPERVPFGNYVAKLVEA